MHYLMEYRTTLAGIAMIFGGLSHLINALLNGDTSTIMVDLTTTAGGFGLIFAKDSKAS